MQPESDVLAPPKKGSSAPKATRLPLPKPATIKLNASPQMMQDLSTHREALDASSNVEAVRRAVALAVILFRKLEDSKCLCIEGKDPKGKIVEITLT